MPPRSLRNICRCGNTKLRGDSLNVGKTSSVKHLGVAFRTQFVETIVRDAAHFSVQICLRNVCAIPLLARCNECNV